MIVAVAVGVGAVVTLALWVGTRPVFERPIFLRENFAGRPVPVAVGVLFAASATFGVAVLTVIDSVGIEVDPEAVAASHVSLLAVVGFTLLGLLDDVAQDSGVSGYRGHVAALVRGRLSAGALKLLAGGALSLVVVAPVAGESAVRLAVDGALVALSANLANLLDRAPGRVLKVSVVAMAAVIAGAGAGAEAIGVGFVGGAALALLVPDLREKLMLGDAGSNALGATTGLGLVLNCSEMTRTIVMIVVLGFNLLSEVVSFSAVIRRVGPLRLLDEWGRELP
ncbi:MAG: hypothetical protein IT195_06795 [Microthrixaceae bacterium]|nr:hypothetical protein [Microthrixaceae bacterium]